MCFDLVSIDQTEGSTRPACPTLMCFFVCLFLQGWYLVDFSFEKFVFDFLYVCFVLYLRRCWLCGVLKKLRFDDFCAELLGDVFTFVSSLDVILCGWLGTKHQLPTYLWNAYCQGFLPGLFLPFRSIHLHFYQSLPRFLPCWLWLIYGSCVGPQNKIGHPAGCRFPCWVPTE